MKTVLAILWAACLSIAPPALAQTYGTMADASLGIDAPLNGDVSFPADNAWNTDISAMPVDPNSANLIASIGLTTGLHPDFGSGIYRGRHHRHPLCRRLVRAALRHDHAAAPTGNRATRALSRAARRADRGLQAGRRSVQGRSPRAGDRQGFQPPLRDVQLLSAAGRQLGRRGRRDLPPQFRRCAPDRQARLDQRRRRRPADLPRAGAL